MRNRSDPSAAGEASAAPLREGRASVAGDAQDAADAEVFAGAEVLAEADAPRSRRVRVGVGAVVVLLIAAAVVAVLLSATAQQGSSVAVPTAVPGWSGSPVGVSATPSAAPAGEVLIHVTGAVRKPGLVSLAVGARVVDAVAAAGGLADDADPAGVNLARPVADGEQLAVPRIGEAPAAPGAGSAGASGGAGAAAAGAPVNLNTATQAELETLPRIGPALAQRILEWRQANGRFAQATDLLKVSGIGQKLFDGLKARVVV